MKHIFRKLKELNKRYYILFAFLLLFSVYNTVTLRGFYYTENYPGGHFGCMDWWHGYTNVPNRTYPRESMQSSSGFVSQPETIHDISNGHEWYGSILGTVVFVKWKWVGLHFGNKMILIDTWVPDMFAYPNHILGHPYYILSRYSSEKYESSKEQSDEITEQWLEMSKTGKEREQIQAKYARQWMKNYKIYRRNTLIFYGVCLLAIVMGITVLIRKVRK